MRRKELHGGASAWRNELHGSDLVRKKELQSGDLTRTKELHCCGSAGRKELYGSGSTRRNEAERFTLSSEFTIVSESAASRSTFLRPDIIAVGSSLHS
ncbi:Os07g0153451 [Oryza sativa Japonica Group]|uniref:Os07g0153451 protein n=1 Tax=Oryza sativa subsp. japonica TaxID=39947 RepID=A0A0P0X2N6_ORYSJ|nr:Os07g0153451 [Oryza sativa Japonica Group]